MIYRISKESVKGILETKPCGTFFIRLLLLLISMSLMKPRHIRNCLEDEFALQILW